MIQFWRGIDYDVLCVTVLTIACNYLQLRKPMYKAVFNGSGVNVPTEVIVFLLSDESLQFTQFCH